MRNVWEWCADWHSPAYYARSSRGPSSGMQRVTPDVSCPCHASYCRRYRVAARTP